MLTEKQLRFYAGNGWDTPEHCAFCLKMRRRERADHYYGIYEVMTSHVTLKKRKQRVHYKPHVVGGFR